MLRFVLRCSKVTRSMSIFAQNLNPITGTINWEEKDPDYDYHQEVARSAFADMLHDRERNQKYYIALKAAINKKHRAGQEANVLDIGTGTGLLSMMSVKCGADSVTACEAFKPMADCALKIMKENGFEGRIRLIPKRSTEMTVGEGKDMPKRANILVTEVFDTELIGEGALSTFRHAHKVLLEKDCIVVPNSGTVFAQVVESSMVHAWNRVQPLYDVDGREVLVDSPNSIKTCSGAAAVHDLQLTRLPRSAFTPLLPPQSIFKFDWSGNSPLEFNESVCLNVKPIATGTAHAVFMWWELEMDTDGQVHLSCAPVWEHPDTRAEAASEFNLDKLTDKIPWRDHWMQAVYYLPTEIPVHNNEVILVGSHDEYSFWFHLKNEPKIEDKDCQRPVCECCVHVAYSRTRIGQLSDKERNEKYVRTLRKKITPDTICLCLSDGCLLALAAAKLGAKKIIILESNSLSRRTMETYVKTNGLSKKVEIIDSINHLSPNDKVDLIFGEPYFVTSILPWDNLRFWYLVSKYSNLSDVPRIPISVTIRGVAIEFKDLHKIRIPLDTCEGFDMSSFDKLVQASSDICDSPVEAHPLWEYPGRALSLPFVLTNFDLTKDVNLRKHIKISDSIPILSKGLCNGVALWVDWQLDSDTVISSGPISEIIPGACISWDPHTRQGVHLFRKISQVTDQDILSWSLNFVPLDGDMQFHFNVIQKNMRKVLN